MLHTTLREIANSVIRDTENTAKMVGSPTGDGMEEVEEEEAYDDPSYLTSTPFTRTTPKNRSPSPSRAIRLRSLSPTRARTPAVADSAVSAVQSAMKKRQLQVQVIFRHEFSSRVFCEFVYVVVNSLGQVLLYCVLHFD